MTAAQEVATAVNGMVQPTSGEEGNKNDTSISTTLKRTSEASWVPVVGDTAKNPNQFRDIKRLPGGNIPGQPRSINCTVDRLQYQYVCIIVNAKETYTALWIVSTTKRAPTTLL
jgi:hypothetical protein